MDYVIDEGDSVKVEKAGVSYSGVVRTAKHRSKVYLVENAETGKREWLAGQFLTLLLEPVNEAEDEPVPGLPQVQTGAPKESVKTPPLAAPAMAPKKPDAKK